MARIQGLQPILLLDPHHPSPLLVSMVWAEHLLYAADYQGLGEAVLLEILLKRAF